MLCHFQDNLLLLLHHHHPFSLPPPHLSFFYYGTSGPRAFVCCQELHPNLLLRQNSSLKLEARDLLLRERWGGGIPIAIVGLPGALGTKFERSLTIELCGGVAWLPPRPT